MHEPKENSSPLSLPPVKRDGGHRLSIVDLLLITLGTAVALWIMPREPIATQPGHWLLLLIGCTFLGNGSIARGGVALDKSAPGAASLLLAAGGGLLLSSLGLLIYRVVANVDLSTDWRRVFRLLATTLTVPIFGGGCLGLWALSGAPKLLLLIPAMFAFGPPILLLASTIAAIVSDYRRREARDIWHWLGIAAFFAMPVHLGAALFMTE